MRNAVRNLTIKVEAVGGNEADATDRAIKGSWSSSGGSTGTWSFNTVTGKYSGTDDFQ